jgi:hypothetical protein
MKTKLDRLLESIDPARTLDQVSSRADEAVNSFRVQSGIIKDWEGFRTVLTEFYRHVENVILRIRSFRSPNPDIDWGCCYQLLIKEYGPNGEKASFELARTGSEQGLYGVLKAIARRMIDDYAGNEIAARISNFWESLSIDEKLAVSKEYLDKYGHLLPSELTSGSAARVRANFLKVLEQHPSIMKRLRKIGRG